MSTTDPGNWTSPWKALLFPLDEWSGDFRRVRGGGNWKLPGGSGRVTLDPVDQYEGPPIVGRVDRVWVKDGSVYAAGVIDPAVKVEGLRPQADLGGLSQFEPVDLGDGELGCDLIADTLWAVRLSAGVPAWTDVWIEVGPAVSIGQGVNAADEHSNNLVAAGALYMLLSTYDRPGLTEVTLPDGPSNRIDVRFDFLKSAYRLTVERVPDDDKA